MKFALPVCGETLQSLRIVGGEIAQKNEYPWQAGITTHDKGEQFLINQFLKKSSISYSLLRIHLLRRNSSQ